MNELFLKYEKKITKEQEMLIDLFHRYENLRRDLEPEIRETTKKEINLGIEFLERDRSEKNIYI